MGIAAAGHDPPQCDDLIVDPVHAPGPRPDPACEPGGLSAMLLETVTPPGPSHAVLPVQPARPRLKEERAAPKRWRMQVDQTAVASSLWCRSGPRLQERAGLKEMVQDSIWSSECMPSLWCHLSCGSCGFASAFTF